MLVKAQAKWVRISPRKARRVMDLVRGKKASKAMDILKLLPQKGARLILKVIKSAVANAKHNYKLTESNLVVNRACVDEAPMFKRFKARSRGRAAPIIKRNSHITIWVKDMSAKGA